MKKGMMLMLLMIASSIMFAQPERKSHGYGHANRTEEMKTVLALDDKQYSTIKAINEKYAEQHAQLKTKSDEERKSAMKALKTERKKEIDAVLTSEQKAKWQTYKAEKAEQKKVSGKRGSDRSEQMKTELGLSDDQVEKLQKAHADFKAKTRSIKGENKQADAADKAALQKARAEHQAAVKAILTEEQFKKWSERHSHKKSRAINKS